MIRHFFMFNLSSIDALARSERWYWRLHAPEAVRGAGPWLRRYESYRTVQVPVDLSWLGYYNYRRTEMWFEKFEPMEPPFDMSWYDEHAEDWQSGDDPYNGEWLGRKGGPYVPVQAFIPAIAEIDINRRSMKANTPPPTLRLTGTIRFPNDSAAADAWFVENVINKLADCEGMTRVLSSKPLEVPEFKLREFSRGEPKQFVWNRWFEFRFTTFQPFVDMASHLFGETTSRWNVEAYTDLVTTLHLERPDWTLRDLQSFP
jgi:hypothetical protein